MSVFNEDTRVKIPATIQFLRLGYEYQSLRDIDLDKETRIAVNRFKPALEKINGRTFSDEEIKSFLGAILLSIKNNDMGRNFYQWLINPQDRYRLIDFDNTNVSILFLDKANKSENVILIDASKLGEKYKEGKNQRTLLREFEVESIINTFINREQKDDFSVVVSFDDIKGKNYSFSAGQYFEVKIEYVDIVIAAIIRCSMDY